MTEERLDAEPTRRDPERHLAEVLNRLRSAHFDEEGVACDFPALAGSKERGQLAACLAELEAFDPKQVRIAAQTAFWINLFNAGVLRDAPELELSAGEHDLQAFFERPRLKIFGHRFSLDDIHHGLLRGNMPKHGRLRPPMARDDPRRSYMPIAYDERMHFAMYCASRSSPALRVFETGKVDEQLEQAAGDYIRRSARIERDGAVVVAPRLFQWYAADFGGESGVVEFVLGRLEDDAVEKVDRMRGRVKLQYSAFDWSLNRR
jgi:hypothetical protein